MKRPLFSLNIVVDNSEKQPFIFPRQHKVRFSNLRPRGSDYSVWGYTKLLGVERKSYGDWANSVSVGWRRFKESLGKLMKRRYRCIVIEKPIGWFVSKHSSVSEDLILHRTAEICARNIPVVYCNTKDMAMRFTLSFLRRSIERMTK